MEDNSIEKMSKLLLKIDHRNITSDFYKNFVSFRQGGRSRVPPPGAHANSIFLPSSFPKIVKIASFLLNVHQHVSQQFGVFVQGFTIFGKKRLK